MMRKLQLLTLLISGLLVACNSSDDGDVEEEAPPGITYKSLHLVHLPDSIDESALKDAVRIMNEAVGQTGNTVAGYKLWKVSGEDSVYNYFVEGEWADKATYDHIHEDITYQLTIEENQELLEQVFADQMYKRVTRME